MRHLVLLVLLVGCGKEAIAPPPPAIVKLIMVQDTGFWRGGAVRLSSLVRGAITDHGDTVAAPAVTWSLPAGFAKQGDSILATREARGGVRATLSGTVLDSTTAASMDDLSANGKLWTGGYRCYGGAWDATRTTDSVIYGFYQGAVFYSQAPWKGGLYQAEFRFDSVSEISYLSDGTVDTLALRPNGGERHYFQQDTGSLRFIASDADTIAMQRPIDTKYVSATAVCTTASGWQKDGTPWELTTP